MWSVGVETAADTLDCFSDARAGFKLAGDATNRVQDRRVIAVEMAADFGKREVGEITGQVNPDVSRTSDVGCSSW